MSANRVETATSADWSFVDRPAIMRCIRNAAIKAANEFDAVEFGDAEHDALLWLAVRPERLATADRSGDYTQLTQDIYAHALRERAVRESDRNKATVWLDAPDAEEVES